mgnify:CR=1 FL=1
MIFVSIRLIEGCIVAKSALIAGIGDRNALFDGMVCQIEAFFCYVFPIVYPFRHETDASDRSGSGRQHLRFCRWTGLVSDEH